jgi:hypothetical protein
MIDRQQATMIMQAWMTAHRANSPDGPLELCLLDEQTLEEGFGWVFFYTSKFFHDTGDHRYALAGNAPMIVHRSDGSIQPTGTAYPLSHYLAEHRSRLGL